MFPSNFTVSLGSLCLLPWLPLHSPFLVCPFVSMAHFQSAFLAYLTLKCYIDELIVSALHSAPCIVSGFVAVLISVVIIFAYTFPLIS